MAKKTTVVNLDPIDRKKKIGLIGRLMITTYHGGKKVQKTDPFGHYMFCGEQRAGKTASVLWYLEKVSKKYKRKRLKFINETGELESYSETPRIRVFSNFGIGKAFKREELFKLIDELNPHENEVRFFLVDEIHTYFPKDGMQGKEDRKIVSDLNAVFSQLGKRNVYLFSTAQVYGRLDKALREQCLYMVDCHLNFNKTKIVNEFIPQKDIIADDLGRWAGRPKRIYVHGLSKLAYDTKKLIRE